MRPFARILANGKDITADLGDRLLSIEVRDEAEDKSDRVTIILDDRERASDAAIVDLPAFGLTVSVTLGFLNGPSRSMESYFIDDVSIDHPPATLTVSGRSANMPTSFRTPRTESYHQTTLQEVFDKLAERNGFEAVVDEGLGEIVVRHADQHGESDMKFGARLAADHDAVAKPVAGKLVVARRGTGKSAVGSDLPLVTVRPSDCAQWSFKYAARDEPGESESKMQGTPERTEGDSRLPNDLIEFEAGQATQTNAVEAPTPAGKKGGVRAYWNDIRTGERKEVTVGKEPFHDLRYTYHNEAEARAAVSAYRNKNSRGKASFSCMIGGRPSVQAEAKMILSGFRPYMPTEWRVKSVSHRFEPGGGYTTSIDAELFDAQQDDVADGVDKTTPTKDDKVDKDAPEKARRKGSTKGGTDNLSEDGLIRFE